MERLIRHEAEPSAGLETHSEYVISRNVRGYTGTLTGLLYEYGAFQTKMAEKSLAVRLYASLYAIGMTGCLLRARRRREFS